MSGKKPPYAYELKRIVAQHWRKIWLGDEVRGIATAPVYVFPDEDKFDAESVIDAASRLVDTDSLEIPEPEFVFEIHRRTHADNNVEVILVYGLQDGGRKFAYMFVRHHGKWSDTICRTRFEDGGPSFVHNPANLSFDNKQSQSAIVSSIVRGIAILAAEPDVVSETVSGVKRQLLKAKGVSGWEYKIVDIDTEKLKVRPRESVGTHASPRWHMRRGHWRRLASGARVFVRACEVGDKSRGGVVKDYVVV